MENKNDKKDIDKFIEIHKKLMQKIAKRWDDIIYNTLVKGGYNGKRN